MAAKRVYTFTTCKVAVFTWHGCTLQVRVSFDPPRPRSPFAPSSVPFCPVLIPLRGKRGYETDR